MERGQPIEGAADRKYGKKKQRKSDSTIFYLNLNPLTSVKKEEKHL